MSEKRTERSKTGLRAEILALGAVLAIGAVAGGLVWGLAGTSALFGAYMISFPFGAAECFLLGGAGYILNRETRVRGILSIAGRVVAAALALGLSYLFLHLTGGALTYLLASATVLFAGYACGIFGAWKEGAKE